MASVVSTSPPARAASRALAVWLTEAAASVVSRVPGSWSVVVVLVLGDAVVCILNVEGSREQRWCK